MVNGPLVEDVVIAGDHHDGQRETIELRHGPVEQRVGDTRVIEQVAGDEHRVDLFRERQVDRLGERRLLAPAVVAREMAVGGVEDGRGAARVGRGQRSTLRPILVGGAQRGVSSSAFAIVSMPSSQASMLPRVGAARRCWIPAAS